MKKQNSIPAILLVLALGLSANAVAQSDRPVSPVEKGTVIFNAGIGTGADYSSDYYNSAFGLKGAIEMGMWQAGPGIITLGAEAGGSFSSGGYNANNSTNYRANTFVVAARSAWHHGWNIPGLDTYAGLSTGAGFHRYHYINKDNFKVNQTEVIPVFGGFVGASYFFTPALGVNLEAGYDITQIQAGIILKIK